MKNLNLYYSIRWIFIALGLGAFFSLVSSIAHADNVQYSYDQLGHVVKAANMTSGQSVVYSYDPVGNITSTSVVANGAVSIASFSPNQASVGAQVTISGAGFNATASSNTVTFNGVSASVISASTTQLVVSVPSGATTGPIAVANAAGTGTSVSNFIVSSNSSVPTITSFTPTVAAQGATITIAGTNFKPSSANNTVLVNQYSASVSAASTTSLTAVLSPSAISGKVQVITLDGTAISNNDLIVVPQAYSASSVGTSGRIPTNATPTVVSLTTPNKIAIELFDGVEDQYLTLGISNNTISSAAVTVYGPTGARILSTTIASSTPAIQLPRLLTSGTYSVIIDPGANAGSLTLTVRSPLTGAITIGGPSQSVQITNPGQRAIYSFTGTAGSYVSLAQNSISLTGNVTVFDPNGVQLLTGKTQTAATLRPLLPISGAYTILVDPIGAVTGNDTLTLTSGPTAALNYPSNYGAALNGSSGGFYFHGAAGDYMALTGWVNNSAITSANVSVYSPDETLMSSGSMSTTVHPQVCYCTTYDGSLVLNLGLLPYSGTYVVAIQQTGGGSGTMTFQLTQPVSGSIPTNGSSNSFSPSAPGQGILLGFSAGTNNGFLLGVSESSSGIKSATINLISPQGTVVASSSFTPTEGQTGCGGFGGCKPNGLFTGSTSLSTGVLPIGQYQISIVQTYSGTGTLSVSLTPQ